VQTRRKTADSNPRLQVLLCEQQGDTPGGMATVSKPARETTICQYLLNLAKTRVLKRGWLWRTMNDGIGSQRHHFIVVEVEWFTLSYALLYEPFRIADRGDHGLTWRK
jgi:hypothetical protein